MKRILIIQAHPHASGKHYCHALAQAYEAGAKEAGHHVDLIDLGELEVPFIRSKAQWEDSQNLPVFVDQAQKLITEADHLLFIYPLWMGTMPALLKAWLEQVFRSSFAFNIVQNGQGWEARLGGQSARLVVTMGMPALFYRLFYRSHGLKNFKRNILKFSGIKPVRTSLIGMVDKKDDSARQQWLGRMREYGRKGA